MQTIVLVIIATAVVSGSGLGFGGLADSVLQVLATAQLIAEAIRHVMVLRGYEGAPVERAAAGAFCVGVLVGIALLPGT